MTISSSSAVANSELFFKKLEHFCTQIPFPEHIISNENNILGNSESNLIGSSLMVNSEGEEEAFLKKPQRRLTVYQGDEHGNYTFRSAITESQIQEERRWESNKHPIEITAEHHQKATTTTGKEVISEIKSTLAPQTIHVENPIETPNQFLEWFNRIERDLEHEQEQVFRDFIHRLTLYEQVCQELLDGISEIEGFLDELVDKYKLVNEKSKGIQDTCEKVLTEQRKLASTVEQLRRCLGYFNDLDPVTRLFSSSDPNVCLNDAFIPMLRRIDDTIGFLESKINFKDGALYILKYRQCMTRGLTIMKNFIVGALKGLDADIRSKMSNMSNDDANIRLRQKLLYDKFQNLGMECKPLIAELEERCAGFDDYNAMRKVCIQVFFNIRKQLLWNNMQENAKEMMDDPRGDVGPLVKNCISYIQAWIQRENAVFRVFFNSSKEEFLEYVDQMCQVFYVNIRPSIIRENRIEVLSDLFDYIADITFLAPSATVRSVPFSSAKSANLPSLSSLNTPRPTSPQSGNRSRSISRSHSMVKDSSNPPSLKQPQFEKDVLHEEGEAMMMESAEEWMMALAHILDEYAQDIQQRLVFRAQSYVQEIGSFKPRDPELVIFVKAGSLKAESLLATQSSSIKKKSDSMTSGVVMGSRRRRSSFAATSISRKNKYMFGSGEWYPPVQKSLWILSIMYTASPNQVFQEIAQECLDICRKSLHVAAAAIARLFTRLEANIFLFKHFVFLRDEIQQNFSGFEFTKQERTLRLEVVVNKAMQSVVMQRRMNMQLLGDLGKGFFEAVASPAVSAKNCDAKQMIDEDLKRVYEDLILDISQKTMEPIITYMIKVKALKLSSVSQQHHHPERIKESYGNFIGLLNERFKPSILKVRENLLEHSAVHTLFRYLKGNIIDYYTEFYEFVRELMNSYVGHLERLEEDRNLDESTKEDQKLKENIYEVIFQSLKPVDELSQMIQNMMN